MEGMLMVHVDFLSVNFKFLSFEPKKVFIVISFMLTNCKVQGCKIFGVQILINNRDKDDKHHSNSIKKLIKPKLH